MKLFETLAKGPKAFNPASPSPIAYASPSLGDANIANNINGLNHPVAPEPLKNAPGAVAALLALVSAIDVQAADYETNYSMRTELAANARELRGAAASLEAEQPDSPSLADFKHRANRATAAARKACGVQARPR